MYKLSVDNTSEGYNKEIVKLDELKKELLEVLDDRVIEVHIKRRATLSGPSKNREY